MGSVKAGPKVAAILSVVESCRQIGAPVKEYLADVLPGLDRRTLSEGRQPDVGALERLPWLMSTWVR